MIKTLFRTSLALFLTALSAGLGAAQSLPDNLIRAELLPGWRTASGSQMAAVRLTLAPGWKTYWRAPGASGIPPQFNWSGSSNIGRVAYHWPRPEVFDLNGMRTLAYKDELILPVEFFPVNGGETVSITGHIDLGVCEEICVPISVDISGELSAARKADPAIRAALAAGPQSGAKAGIATPVCAVSPLADGLRLRTDIALPRAAQGDFAVIELADSSVWVSSVETSAGNGRLTDISDLVPATAKPFALDRSSVRITVFASGGNVFDLQGCTG
jgi:hypothetical protein